MIYALASAATDPLEMLSRSRRSPPLSLSLPLSLPLSSFPLSPSGEKAGLGRNTALCVRPRPYLHIDCLPFLTPEILPIVTDASARECERDCICIRGGLSRSACKEPRPSLARFRFAAFAAAPAGPRKAARYHAGVQQGILRCVTTATIRIRSRRRVATGRS